MSKNFTYNEVKNFIENSGENYILLSQTYINSYTEIQLKCNNGHIYNTTLNRFKQGKRCPECYDNIRMNKIRNAKEYFINYQYNVIGDFNKIGESVLVQCPNGHQTKMRFGDFKRGHRCKYCSNNNIKYTYEDVKNYFKSYGYELLSKDYINNKTELNIRCCHGHEFQMRLDVFKRGIRCPYCNCSSGESEIMKILNDNKIDYDFQYCFDGCIDKQPLPFDFYIKSKNTCIEFDGEQHYRPVDWFGGVESFNLTKKHDKIKDNYCIDNNINLIRIPYWDFDNISQILKIQNII